MKQLSKLLAVLLAAIMLLSTMAVTSFASETDSLKKIDGTWYYMADGEKNTEYTGLVKYYDTWYYVENGVLNWNFTDVIDYYNTWYYVENGILNWDKYGLAKCGDKWCYFVGGVLDWNYTGLTNYYGTWYYVDAGILKWNYYGLTNYYGTWYGVECGVLNWNFSGVLLYGETLYYVQNGVMDWTYNDFAKYCTGKTYYFSGSQSVDYSRDAAIVGQAIYMLKNYGFLDRPSTIKINGIYKDFERNTYYITFTEFVSDWTKHDSVISINSSICEEFAGIHSYGYGSEAAPDAFTALDYYWRDSSVVFGAQKIDILQSAESYCNNITYMNVVIYNNMSQQS